MTLAKANEIATAAILMHEAHLEHEFNDKCLAVINAKSGRGTPTGEHSAHKEGQS